LLGELSKENEAFSGDYLNVLRDEKVDSSIRKNSLSGFTGGRIVDETYIKVLNQVVSDDKVDASVRSNSARELVKLGYSEEEIKAFETEGVI